MAAQDEWLPVLEKVRDIFLKHPELSEAVKWGAPAYLLGKKNLFGLMAFKNFVGLWFHQGALLEDKEGLLINAQEGVTKAMRQMRFTSLKEVKVNVIKKYIDESIANQKAGKEIKPERKSKKLEIDPLLNEAFKADKKLKSAFGKLTPSCQREYAEYINAAKRASTKERRLDKIKGMILDGKGLHNKYK